MGVFASVAIGAGVLGVANAVLNKPAAPATPDYAGAAVAQGQANIDAARLTAKLNNPNMVTPYGNQTVTFGGTPQFDQAGYDAAMQAYNQSGSQNMYDEYGNFQGGGGAAQPTREQYTTVSNADQPTITQTLTPAAQQALDNSQAVQAGLSKVGLGVLGNVSDTLSKPFASSAPNIQTSLGMYAPAQTSLDLSNVAAMPVNAGMTGQNAIMARLNPQIQAQNASLAQSLANQGVTPGSEAWKTAMAAQGQTQNDQLNQAALYGINLDMSANNQGYNQALSTGGFYNQGVAQNFNQGLNAAQFGNTASNQQYQRDLSNYNMPINTLAAIESGSQIQNPQFQSYSGGGNIAAAPIANATTQAGNFAQGQYGNAVAANNATTQGLFSIAGTAGAGAAKNPSGLFGTSIPSNTNNGYF